MYSGSGISGGGLVGFRITIRLGGTFFVGGRFGIAFFAGIAFFVGTASFTGAAFFVITRIRFGRAFAYGSVGSIVSDTVIGGWLALFSVIRIALRIETVFD